MFVGDVPLDRQAAYRSEMEEMVAYFAEKHGVEPPAFSMVVGVDVEAVRSIYADYGAGSPEMLSPGVRLAQVRGDIDALFVSGSSVLADPFPYFPLVLRYFRVLWRDLSDLAHGTPSWLVDGSTFYATRIYADERKGSPFDDFREFVIVWAATLDVPLKSLENYDLWVSRGSQGLNAGILATEWLAREAGESSYIDYWRELATSATWEEAFSAAFGMTTDEFYTAFDEYTRELFADILRIAGTVLGPDGQPLQGVGVRAWQGGLIGSTTAPTKADGTFVVRIRDGNYAIQVFPEPPSTAPFAGWWKDGGGLTRECSETARVIIRGADATGLVIRLPAGWDEGLPAHERPDPSCTAAPRSAPEPTPTPTPVPTYPDIVFVGDVSPDRQAVYRAAMADVVAYYADRYGVEAPAFALYIGADVEAARAVYRELGAASPDTFGAGGRVARLGGGTDAMFLAGSFVSGGPAHTLLMAHEYFHVLQRHLSEFAPGPSLWLVEGSAHYSALLYISDEGIRPYDVDRKNVISFAAGLDIPFRDLDHDLGHWREQFGAVYNAGVLASEWLIGEAGKSAYIDFWRLLATEANWQAAFSAAFGISVDDFHDAFEEHTTDLFADLQWIEGVVLGPDGEPLNGVGVEAWHGGRVGSSTAKTRAQGAFALRVWDGTYHLLIYPDRSARTGFAGWLRAGGGLTAECDEAAIVSVEGADVTGIVIRLPAGWDENLPTLASTQWACVALPKVRGTVLGPDGDPAGGIGLWLWGGSTDNSKFAGNAPDGTFDLAHQNGTYVIRVYVWRDAAWDHIGWYGGDTGFTTALAQATEIEVDDTNVTGIEIRLSADPADLPTVH